MSPSRSHWCSWTTPGNCPLCSKRRTAPLSLLLLLQIPKPARKRAAAKRAIVNPHVAVPLLAKNKVVFRVDLREYPAVGELVGLRVARQFEIHDLVEIGAAGHEGYILSHPSQAGPVSPVVVH